jgi:hypothetical protein
VETVLRKPANQDVMVELMRALAAYSAGLPDRKRLTTIAEIEQEVEARMSDDDRGGLAGLLQEIPEYAHHIRAALFLSLLDEPVLDPVFSRTDAIGTVMRSKLQPLIEPVREQIGVLRGP